MACPKCGSRNIVIVSSDVLTFKCKDCGHTWTHNPKLGYVKTPSGEVHWTEKTYYRELAIEDARDLLKSGKRDEEVLAALQEKYSQYLDQEELRRIVEKARRLLELY